MSEKRKIAAVEVALVVSDVTGPEYRYRVWERNLIPGDAHNAPQGKMTHVVLRYCDDLIMDVIERAKIKFNIRQLNAKVMPVQMQDDRFVLPLYSQIDAAQDLQIVSLGEHRDYDCYMLFIESPLNTPYYFNISHMPDYGRGTVVWSPDVTRETIFNGHSGPGKIAMQGPDRFSACGPISRMDLHALWDFIDSKVFALMQEPIQRCHDASAKSKE